MRQLFTVLMRWQIPSLAPTTEGPTNAPTLKPTLEPTVRPTRLPSNKPTLRPTSSPTSAFTGGNALNIIVNGITDAFIIFCFVLIQVSHDFI